MNEEVKEKGKEGETREEGAGQGGKSGMKWGRKTALFLLPGGGKKRL